MNRRSFVSAGASASFYADRSRSPAGARPWLLMEQGTTINHGADAVPLPGPAHGLRAGAVAHELPHGRCAVPRRP
ncbi:hypothetical protein ACFYZE_07195 [Streptomyces sp. NPDC001796]|uniref:hypothetical protein n=1 Tax=Streptomyces sp. NPDC001796 TaxID=3364609 RepID=UPI003680A1AC